MLDHKALWCILAKNKQIKPYHVVQYVILKALDKSKGDYEKAKKYVIQDISTAFSPIKSAVKLVNGMRPWQAVEQAALEAQGQWSNIDVLGAPYEALGDLKESYKNLCQILSSELMIRDYNNRHYVYIFVRQDLSREQQAVQASHVAYKAGYEIAKKHSHNVVILTGEKPEQTYFTLVGVRNEKELSDVAFHLERRGIHYEVFFEPDIGQQATALATRPIPVRERGDLLKYKLLKMW